MGASANCRLPSLQTMDEPSWVRGSLSKPRPWLQSTALVLLGGVALTPHRYFGHVSLFVFWQNCPQAFHVEINITV